MAALTAAQSTAGIGTQSRAPGVARRSVLGAALTGVVGAACGAPGESSGVAPGAAPVTLWWWNEQDMLPETEGEILRDFPQRYPHITLQPTKVIYTDLTKKLLAGLAAGDSPDVTYTHGDWIATFAQRRITRPLDDLARKDRGLKLQDYYPAAVDFQRWRGALHGLSWLMEGGTLFYNKSLMEQSGLADPRDLDRRGQWTWERFGDYLVRLSRGGGDQAGQRTWGWNQGVTGKMSTLADTLWAYGAEPFSPDGLKLTLHTPPAVEAIEWRISHYRQRLTTAGDPDSGGVTMNSGRIGFWRANRLHTPTACTRSTSTPADGGAR